ncbi:unnamed protein product [Candida verbasci]|uniref:Ribosomal protein L35 n=1 Tax=Candida verbasci TaxID=1227364 RepID=A0A9W4XAV4_9ASCO|nr:unnamed protein product [Candida verbasci]
MFNFINRSIGQSPITNILLQTRNKMKTSKTIRNRIFITAEGIKRKRAGTNHGNGRFSAPSLKHLRGFITIPKTHGLLKRYKQFIK